MRSSAGSLVLLCVCTWEKVATMHVMLVLLLWRYAITVSVDIRRFSSTGIISEVRNPSLSSVRFPFAYQESKV